MADTPVTTTRSGRAIRRVVRYEPDPDTVFEDENDYSDDSICVDDESEEDHSEMEDESSESEISSEDSDDDEEEEELETVAEDDQYLEDALDWDRLTELAGSEAESEMTEDDED